MNARVVATEAFCYTVENGKLANPATGYGFAITSTWLGAKDPTAEHTVVQITLNAQGLLALRDLIESELQS